jgi:nicotinate-nucleotide pyrophosphorylase (carboxylating)
MRDLTVIDSMIKNALHEDIGSGDITSSLIIPERHRSQGMIVAKETFVLAGINIVKRVFKMIDPKITFKSNKKDGEIAKKGVVIAELRGSTRSLLAGERIALNFLQRLSGIATLTHRFKEKIKDLPVKITDTRKTTPGLRLLEKYAVRVGGGSNHRAGLFDGILIKDNHIAVAGGIIKSVEMVRKHSQKALKIEVEAKSISQVKQAVLVKPDIIMLDNMSLKEIKKAVKIIKSACHDTIIEASGGITLKNIRQIAKTGVNMISIGTLTHSAKAVDISMDIKPLKR